MGWLRQGVRGLGKRMFSGATELVFPLHCPDCDGLIERGDAPRLCDSCRGELVAVAHPFCNVCGEPFEGVPSSEFRCGNCAARNFHFDFAIAAYRNSGPARGLIHGFKYSRRIALRAELGTLLLRAFEDPRIGQLDGAMLVPVPLHPRKRRERGFNQAEEIARVASVELGLPVVNALRRLRYTDTQAHMQRNQRLHNLRGAMALSRRRQLSSAIGGATVFLIDDVFTTGATAQECARVLKQDGEAARVIVVTVCRAAGFSKPKR